MIKNKQNQKGFTLLELIIVMAVLVIIASMSMDFYSNYAKDAEVQNYAKMIISDLRFARDKAMNGEDDRNWGVHFVNGFIDYYEIFSSPANYADPAKTVIETNYLKSNMDFGLPASGSSLDVVFDKIIGSTTVASVIIISGSSQKTLSVNAQGAANY